MSETYLILPSEQGMRTPPWLYQACCRLLGVERCELDAFASLANSLCRVYYSEGNSGLVGPWIEPTFANPPFKIMAAAVAKAISEATTRGVRSALIGPAGCSQAWFHRLLERAAIYLPNRRLVYLTPDGKATAGARQDTAVYIIDGQWRDRPDVHVLPVTARPLR